MIIIINYIFDLCIYIIYNIIENCDELINIYGGI